MLSALIPVKNIYSLSLEVAHYRQLAAVSFDFLSFLFLFSLSLKIYWRYNASSQSIDQCECVLSYFLLNSPVHSTQPNLGLTFYGHAYNKKMNLCSHVCNYDRLYFWWLLLYHVTMILLMLALKSEMEKTILKGDRKAQPTTEASPLLWSFFLQGIWVWRWLLKSFWVFAYPLSKNKSTTSEFQNYMAARNTKLFNSCFHLMVKWTFLVCVQKGQK